MPRTSTRLPMGIRAAFHRSAERCCARKILHGQAEGIKFTNDQRNREQSRATYLEALRLVPDDYLPRDNFAQFLDQTGDWNQAVRQEQHVSELLPQSPTGYYKTGALLIREGRTSDAADCFSRALVIRSDYEPALNDLGLILANQQKSAEAA